MSTEKEAMESASALKNTPTSEWGYISRPQRDYLAQLLEDLVGLNKKAVVSGEDVSKKLEELATGLEEKDKEKQALEKIINENNQQLAAIKEEQQRLTTGVIQFLKETAKSTKQKRREMAKAMEQIEDEYEEKLIVSFQKNLGMPTVLTRK